MGNLLIERLYIADACNFRTQAFQRYAQLRSTWFSEDSLVNRYTAYYNLLKRSGAAQRETLRWSGDTDIDGKEIDFDAELSYITTWIGRRLRYLDKQLTEQGYALGIDPVCHENQESHESNTTYSITGQKMPDLQQQLKPGIYIRNGRKVIVR